MGSKEWPGTKANGRRVFNPTPAVDDFLCKRCISLDLQDIVEKQIASEDLPDTYMGRITPFYLADQKWRAGVHQRLQAVQDHIKTWRLGDIQDWRAFRPAASSSPQMSKTRCYSSPGPLYHFAVTLVGAVERGYGEPKDRGRD